MDTTDTTTLAFGQTASSSALTGYWSYFKLSFVAPPSDFTLEIDTVNCATQPSPYLRYAPLHTPCHVTAHGAARTRTVC